MRPNSRTPLGEAIEAFLGTLERAGKSDLTLRNYRADLSALRRSAGAQAMASASAIVAARHLQQLKLAQRSWNRHLSTLRQFCDYLVALQALRANPLRAMSRFAVRAQVAEPAGHDDLSALVDRIGRPRDRALVALLLDTGLRIGEALTLFVRDVDANTASVSVPGSRRRIVALAPHARTALRTYLHERDAQPNEPLFATHAGRPLSYAGAHRVFRQYAADSGLTLQRLRANAAASAFRGGATLGQVQAMLGHRHLASTARYQIEDDTTQQKPRPSWRKQ